MEEAFLLCLGEDGGLRLDEPSQSRRMLEVVCAHGYCVVDIQIEESQAQSPRLSEWEQCFSSAFALPQETKEAEGVFRNDQGVALGYRQEDQREFLETRVYRGSKGHGPHVVSPSFAERVTDYDAFVNGIFSILSNAALAVLEVLCMGPGLDFRCITDLTDLPQSASDKGIDMEISSSLLRICSYPLVPELPDALPVPPPNSMTEPTPPMASPATSTDPSDAQIVFGSHTDTSFLTIGLLSRTPGLEVLDHERGWIKIEEKAAGLPVNPVAGATRTLRAVCFVGEFLQVATKKYFRALVHKVRAPAYTAGTTTPRISCPFIIRGRSGAIFDMGNKDKYTHRTGAEAWIPDLDGISMKVLHKILDHKRQKVMNDPRPDGTDWYLMSFPEDANVSTNASF